MKKLQDSTAERLADTSEKTRQITAEMDEVRKLKDGVQDLQLAVTEIGSASSGAAITAAKGRMRFALQNIGESGKHHQRIVNMANELGKMALDRNGLADMKEGLLFRTGTGKRRNWTPSTRAAGTSSTAWSWPSTRTSTGHPYRTSAKNVALDESIRASGRIHQIMAETNDTDRYRLCHPEHGDHALRRANRRRRSTRSKGGLADKFKAARQSSAKIEAVPLDRRR